MSFKKFLFSAAENGQIEIVKFLMDKGCNKNDNDSTGKTALHLGKWSKSNIYFDWTFF